MALYINLGRSPFASPSRELTWRAQQGARTRLSVEWKWLLSSWSMRHFWGTFVFNLRDERCPKSLVIHVNLESYPNPNLPQNLWKSLKTCRFKGVNGNHGKCWDSTESGVLFTSHFQRRVTSLPSSSLTARAAWASRSERQQPWIQAEEISNFQRCRRQNLEGSQICYEKPGHRIQQVILPFPDKQKTFRLQFLEPFRKEFFQANHGLNLKIKSQKLSTEHPVWLWSHWFLWL